MPYLVHLIMICWYLHEKSLSCQLETHGVLLGNKITKYQRKFADYTGLKGFGTDKREMQMSHSMLKIGNRNCMLVHQRCMLIWLHVERSLYMRGWHTRQLASDSCGLAIGQHCNSCWSFRTQMKLISNIPYSVRHLYLGCYLFLCFNHSGSEIYFLCYNYIYITIIFLCFIQYLCRSFYS